MSRKLALLIHSLHSGGAERVLARLANHWAAAGDEVTVITLDAVESDAWELHPQVGRIGLDAMRTSRSRWQALWNNCGRVWRLRRAIRAAGAAQVISFTDKMNVLTLLACVGLPVGVVIAERSQPLQQRLSPGWERLRRRLYPRCRALVVQTEAVAAACRPWVGDRPVYVIPNAAFPGESLADGASAQSPEPALGGPPLSDGSGQRPNLRARSRRVIGVGRLSTEKGFDLLLRAFARVAPQHEDWSLEIVGDGEQRAALESLAAELGLASRVAWPGWLAQPGERLAQADLFVLPSRYEGFPNALLEAMACGLPAISFDCASGPREILRHEVDGLLVPPGDVDALAAALDRLMSDPAVRNRFGQRAREVRTRFDPQAFFARWDEVLASCESS